MTKLSLDSVNAKIERAHEHARLLDEELSAWMKENPYALSRKVNDDFTRHSIIISILKFPPVQRWSLLLGDSIHNLRSALDHLVYAISVHELKTDPPPNEKQCLFLINDTPNDFRSKHWRIDALSLPVQKAIESVQPYNRSHALMPPLLTVLRDFDDADKHRLIKIVLQRPAEISLSATGHELIGEKDAHFQPSYSDVVDGFELATLTTNYPTPDLKLECHATLTICVPHAPGPTGIERRGIEALLLEDLIPEVREVVRTVSAAVTL